MLTEIKLKIYTLPSAFSNPQVVRLFALEKGCEVFLTTLGGEQKGWKYKKINPFGETPCLILEDGTALTESTAICRFLEGTFEGRKLPGETVKQEALDEMWTKRIWVRITYPLATCLHVLHEVLGAKLELVKNEEWGRHCRREALATAAIVDNHLSDGRKWMLGGNEPTLADITLCTTIAMSKFPTLATDLTERFEFLDKYWQSWQERSSFKRAYADGGMLDELAYLKGTNEAEAA
ncbi:hypothetical protein JCM8097_009273 [Rhodosporidiobolus ruineniae]